MPTFVQADQPYREVLEAPGTQLAAAFAAALRVGPVDLNGNDVTVATLLRLRSFFKTQELIKATLDKVYATPASDFLVESIVFYLRVTLARLAPEMSVASEKNIVRKRGSLRPDISIWRGNDVVAAIECKTQLGWNRDGWLPDFEDRESRLHKQHPDAKLFLLVMTDINWPGFGDDARVGQQFFVLLKDIWPGQFDENASHTIVHRVETLISQVLRHAEG
jgi:hypothetical protein